MKLLEMMWPLMAYDAQGTFMVGLQKRRIREAYIFFDGDYGDTAAPIKLWRGDPRKTKFEAYALRDSDLG